MDANEAPELSLRDLDGSRCFLLVPDGPSRCQAVEGLEPMGPTVVASHGTVLAVASDQAVSVAAL